MGTTYTVPTSVVYPGDPTSGAGAGTVIPLPGHVDYEPGTDVSDALLYWLTTNAGGIGTDGYCGMSGASAGDPNTIQFRAEDYPLEYGTVWGLAQNQPSFVDRSGFVWPQVKQHAWRHLIIDGNAARWLQEDNTTYDDGLVDLTGDTTAGTATTIRLATPLGPNQIARLRAATGSVPAISGTTSAGTGTLFTRKSGTGGVAQRAQIASCADDGTTVTLAAGNTCNETLAGAAITIYLGPREVRRNDKLWMFATASPGAKNGVERSWINRNLTLRNLTVRMGNLLGATSVFTEREQWHLFRLRGIDGLTIESTVRGEYIWGDIINTGQTAQQGVKNAPLHAENVTVDGTYISCGRHAITGQGHIGLTVRGVFRDIGRLAWDSETTASIARVLDTTIVDAVFDPGTVFWHQSPAALYGEPHRTVTIGTVNGSDQITIPADMLNGDDLGAGITATGIPAGTYVRRRLSPTLIELSAACTATGAVTATIGPATPFRDFVCDHVDCMSGGFNLAGNTTAPGSRVYFTGRTTAGSPTITDVVFESRVDGGVYTTADLTRKVFQLSGGLFGKNDTPVAVTSTTVEMSTPASGDSGPDRSVTCTVTANDRTMSTTGAFFTAGDKGRAVSGPGIRPGTVIDSFTSGKSVELSLPASSTATGTVTVSGRHRFHCPVGPSAWVGYRLDDCRNIGGGKWGGSSAVWTATGQPVWMLPEGADQVTVRRNLLVGARNNLGAVVRYGLGYFRNPATIGYGPDPDATWTDEDNRFIDCLDSDVVGTPTTTVSLALALDDATAASPTFTVTATRSDAGEVRGWVRMLRNGTTQGTVWIDGDTNEGEGVPWWPSADGLWDWRAEWAGSWDTQSALSNIVTQNVGAASAVATTTALAADLASPQPAGTAIMLAAVVAPDPGYGTVTFRDGATVLGTADLLDAGGVVSLDLPTGLAAGVHSLTAVFGGTSGHATSTSSAVSFTFSAPPADVSTTTSLEASPASPTDEGTTVTLTATVAPAPPGGTVTFKDGATAIGTGTVSAGIALLEIVPEIGSHSFTAVFGGTSGYLGSTSSAVAYTTDELDVTPPVVESTVPDLGAVDVRVTTNVQVSFSEPVTDPVFLLRLDTPVPQAVSGTFTSDDGIDWTFSPAAPLRAGHRYTIIVDDATDEAGLHLPGRYSVQFTTIERSGKIDGPVHIGAMIRSG